MSAAVAESALPDLANMPRLRAIHIFVAIAGLLALLTTASATAAVPIATYSSPPCPSDVAVWHIAYRLYWTSSLGQVTSEAAKSETLAQIEGFANDVSNDSACGVRAVVDVFDEGAAAWPASPESATAPSDTSAFLSAGHYDWIFYRFPTNHEAGYCANTDSSLPASGEAPSFSRFPVDPEGRLACEGPSAAGCTCQPSHVLVEHEWLHAVVGFYNPRLGWPVPDVHGPCEHGYPNSRCPGEGVNEAYFADMMQGKVPENGLLKGIQPDEWTLQGTPANPLIHRPQISIANGRRGHFVVQFPGDLGGPVQLTVTKSSRYVALNETVTRPGSEFEFPSVGSWSVCLDFKGSERYYRSHSCRDWTALPSNKKSHGRSRRFRVLHISHRGSLYRVVTRGLPEGSKATLRVTHAGRSFRLTGRRRGARAIYKVRAKDRRPWRVALRVALPNGRIVKSRPYVLRP